MNRRLTAIVLTAAAALGLCGCSRGFDTEYVVETSYEPVLSTANNTRGDATVASLDELKEILLSMVADGEVVRNLRFNPAYAGDVSADLASACWQVRTQDALCAYCVENIAYDLSKIINHYEALITVVYSKTAEDRKSVVPLLYAADAGELLREAMREGRESLVLLIDRSGYSAEEMGVFAGEIYRSQPSIAPREPAVHVEITSGADMQHLYEFRFDYGLPAEELAVRRSALEALDLFAGVETAALTEGERALLACCALVVRCRSTQDRTADSVYDALIGCEANSRGMAFGYVELCRRLGLSCELVEGQHNREDHCWTIVRIDGEYYHVDPSVCATLGLAEGFLLSDEEAWGAWRWDYFAYPHCVGSLNAASVVYPRPTAARRAPEPEASSQVTAAPEESFLPENEISP